MKHANGTEYALCPKVATDEMAYELRRQYATTDAIAESKHQWSCAIAAAPAFGEPHPDVVDVGARALCELQPGWFWDDTTEGQKQCWHFKARAVLRKLLGR